MLGMFQFHNKKWGWGQMLCTCAEKEKRRDIGYRHFMETKEVQLHILQKGKASKTSFVFLKADATLNIIRKRESTDGVARTPSLDEFSFSFNFFFFNVAHLSLIYFVHSGCDTENLACLRVKGHNLVCCMSNVTREEILVSVAGDALVLKASSLQPLV